MTPKDKLLTILVKKLREKNIDNHQHRKRLKSEIEEIELQGEYEYFLKLYEEGVKYSSNENNLLTAYLLDIVLDFDINKPVAHTYGDFPDCDLDYISVVRDYLKNEWAPKTFGREKVCSIGNYTTFGIKSALIDMARVHDLDRNEILRITTKLPTKDEDGKDLTLDAAVAMSKEVAEYCNKHPDVAEAAKKLVGRIRGRGKHAAGLIIANCRLDELVPLITDTDGTPISAWSEGLHTQDLQPVGLIKFDLLSITNLIQIGLCKKLIKERRGIDIDWSDDSYLNDLDSLTLANSGKLQCVFQFDSPGIRDLVRRGGVNKFDDLVAYTALFRPGPMGVKMHDQYVNRKQGGEEYAIHPLIKPILDNTYGVMCYQEQIMRLLHVVGGIPMRDCYKALKAISKKKGEVFEKYRTQFVDGGMKSLGWNEESVQQLYDQVASFSGYGFNLSHSVCYSVLSARLLYLKTHYPLEFFAAILSCEDDEDKIKEYRAEAERFGIKIKPVDINVSDVKFAIRGEEIYVGLSNIKGIGVEVARRIVEGQPYTSFSDFLNKFGTDASVVKPIVGLRLFKEADPVSLYEFYEYYKNETKKRQDREKRHEVSKQNIAKELRYILQSGTDDNYEVEYAFLEQWMAGEEKEFQHGVDAWRVVKKYKRCVETYRNKVEADSPVDIMNFKPTGSISDDKLQAIYEADISEAERTWYGFGWLHILLKSPDYKGGRTFTDYRRGLEEIGEVGPVEAWIVEKPKKVQKEGKKAYYTLKLQDENDVVEYVTVWGDDYERFKEEFEFWESETGKGNLISIRLSPPKPPYKRLSFESFTWQQRLKPYIKKQDCRLMVLARPIINEVKKEDANAKLKELSLE